MSERDQAKDAGHAPRAEVAAPEQRAPEQAPSGGLFGLPALMQSMELGGEAPPGEVYDAETAQSADVLAHGGWQVVEAEGAGGFGGADEGAGGAAREAAETAREDGRARAAADDAAARLRAAVVAGVARIGRAAEEAADRITADHAATRARLQARHGAALGDLAKAVHDHGRTAHGARSMAGRIHDDGRDALARAVRIAREAVRDAADGGRDALAALEALHAARLQRRALDAESEEAQTEAVGGALAEALRAVERSVRATLERIEAAARRGQADAAEASSRGGDRLARLVADVRYAASLEGGE